MIRLGTYQLSAALDDKIRHLSAAPPREGHWAHPIHAYLGALGGMSQPIAELSQSLGLAFEAGPVLGSCEIAYLQPLRVDQAYRVDTHVLRLERKASRRFGQSDHARLRFDLSHDGLIYTQLEFTMIVPVVCDAE